MTIREWRKKAKLRQADIAEALDVDQASVSKWERGRCLPLRKHQAALSEFFGCSPKELFPETPEERKRKEGERPCRS